VVSSPSTGLDEITKLGEELDDLTIETGKFVGRGSGMHLYEATHLHLASDPETAVDNPSLVERLMALEEPVARHTMPPPDLAAALIGETWNYISGWPLLSRRFFDEYLASGMLETDRSFRSLCEFSLHLFHLFPSRSAKSPLPRDSPLLLFSRPASPFSSSQC
jgi:hypothetical protein